MADLFDYMKWRGDVSFRGSPLCEVDALMFAEMAYVPFDDIAGCRGDGRMKLSDVADEFFKTHDPDNTDLGAIVPSKIVTMFYKMSKCRRFKNIGISHYVNTTSEQLGEQFSALTVYLPNGDIYVAYRGTDDTVVGWEENFDMALFSPVPAQKSAADYINSLSLDGVRKVFVGGQSKGGNLSVYAAVNCSDAVKEKLAAVYNFDGPGFDSEFFRSEKYLSVSKLMHNVFPEESVVGMLFEHSPDYIVVKSTNKGLWQHDSLSWQVEGPHFVCTAELSKSSRTFDASFSTWLGSLSDDERHTIITALFESLYSTDSLTLTDLMEHKSEAWKALASLEPEKKKLISDKLGKALASNAGSIIGAAIRAKFKEIADKIKK